MGYLVNPCVTSYSIKPKPIRPSFLYHNNGMDENLEQILHHEKGQRQGKRA